MPSKYDTQDLNTNNFIYTGSINELIPIQDWKQKMLKLTTQTFFSQLKVDCTYTSLTIKAKDIKNKRFSTK